MGAMNHWDRVTRARISRRRALAGAATIGVAAGALSLVGCGGGGGGGGSGGKVDSNAIQYQWQLPDDSKNAKEGGTDVGPTSFDITGTLDPTKSPSFTTLAVASVSYEPLLVANSRVAGVDPASAEGRKILGGLAEKHEISADATQFTFTMRQGVKFHPVAPVNGRVMDIEDWKFTMERNYDSPLLGASLKSAIDKIEYPDTKTMVFKMTGPNVGFLRLLTSGSASFYVVPREMNDNQDTFNQQPIGTNVRILSKFQPSVGREYKRNVDYWRGKPYIEGWSVPIIPEAANQRAQFTTGVSLNYTPPQTDVLQLRQDYPKAVMLKGDPTGAYWTNFFGYKDFQTSPWADARVRVALRMGVDWVAVRAQQGNTDVFAQAGIPVESRMPTHVKPYGGSYPYWLNPEEKKLGDVSKNFLFDAAEAKKLLSAAGFANGFDMDGFMNGGPQYGTTTYPAEVQLVVDQWKLNLGVNVKLERPQYAEYLPTYYQKRDFKGVAISQPEFTYNEIDQELFNWYHSKGQRYKSFPDSKVDDFIERQRKELDDTKRASIIGDFQKYMADKMYTIPSDGVSGGFGFQQPWYKNSGFTEYKQWIDDKSKYT